MAHITQLYVFGCNFSFVKIGISGNAKARMKQISVGSPIRLEMVMLFTHDLDHVEARKAERELHQFFAPYRVHGEWFSISHTEAIEAAKITCDRLPQIQAPPPKPENVMYIKGVRVANIDLVNRFS